MKNDGVECLNGNVRALLVLMLAALLSACLGAQKTVIQSYPTEAPFIQAQMKTYRWDFSALGKVQPNGGHYIEFDRVLYERVDWLLAAKGYKRVDNGPVDFVLDYRVVIREEEAAMQSASFNTSEANPFGLRWSFDRNKSPEFQGLKPPHDDMLPYQKGTLYLGAFNADNKLVWYHSASRIIGERAGEPERRTALRVTVEKLMAHFPARQ